MAIEDYDKGMTPEQFVRDALWDRYLDVDSEEYDFACIVKDGADEDAFVREALREFERSVREAFAAGRACLNDD